MPQLRLGKSGFRFNASHSFPRDAGYDRFPHGHDYEFTVQLEGRRPPGEMLYDLRQLKVLVEREIIAPLDHSNLDEVLADSSLEALAEWMALRLQPHLPPALRLGLVVWETRSIFVEYWCDAALDGDPDTAACRGSLETPPAKRASAAENRSPSSSDQRERPNKKWRATP